MDKNDILKELHSKDFTELVPSTMFIGEVHVLTSDEFTKLQQHISGSINYDAYDDYNQYNVIKISNLVFIKESLKDIRDNKLNELFG